MTTDEIDKALEPLVEGYNQYWEWWRAMAMAGKPLPPGGVAAVTPITVLEHSLMELKMGVAEALPVNPDVITIEMDVDAAGRPLPQINVGRDPALRTFVRKVTGAKAPEDVDKAVQDHVMKVNKVVYRQWLEVLSERMNRISLVRKDLLPTKIVDKLHGHPDKVTT
jgi:hypothetical protein